METNLNLTLRKCPSSFDLSLCNRDSSATSSEMDGNDRVVTIDQSVHLVVTFWALYMVLIFGFVGYTGYHAQCYHSVIPV